MNNRFPDKIEETTIPDAIVNLMKIIHTELPDEHRLKLSSALDLVIEDACLRRRSLATAQECLGQLRLDMKYLMFDLEATRREKAALEIST